MKGKDSLAIDLARRNLKCDASERYEGYVVISWLKRIPNEVVKCNALARVEEVRRFPFRHIESVKSPDGRLLGSNHVMRNAFRAHFCDHFARCPDLLNVGKSAK